MDTHPKKWWPRPLFAPVRLARSGRACLVAGLEPADNNAAPGTRNDATDASQHGNGPDKMPAVKMRLPLFLLFFDDGSNFLFSTARHLLLSFPSHAGQGKHSEVLASDWMRGELPIWLGGAAPDVVSLLIRQGVSGGVLRCLGGLPPEEAPL